MTAAGMDRRPWSIWNAADYNLVILDIMMPRLDGLSVLRKMRSGGNPVPVLLLTAKDAVSDRVQGLDAGADDYLTKPYAFEELMARIRALVRRNSTEKSDVLTVGDLSVELSTKRVMRGGKEILLSAKEFGLLETLIRHKGQGAFQSAAGKPGMGFRLRGKQQYCRRVYPLSAAEGRRPL